jgi:hypothetical protein
LYFAEVDNDYIIIEYNDKSKNATIHIDNVLLNHFGEYVNRKSGGPHKIMELFTSTKTYVIKEDKIYNYDRLEQYIESRNIEYDDVYDYKKYIIIGALFVGSLIFLSWNDIFPSAKSDFDYQLKGTYSFKSSKYKDSKSENYTFYIKLNEYPEYSFKYNSSSITNDEIEHILGTHNESDSFFVYINENTYRTKIAKTKEASFYEKHNCWETIEANRYVAFK